MSEDVHVRFCESLRGRFPWATRLAFKITRDMHRWLVDNIYTPRLQEVIDNRHKLSDVSEILEAVGDISDLDVYLRKKLERVGAILPIMSFIPQSPPIFLGRDNELLEIRRRLITPQSKEKNHFLVVHGWPGIGKSALSKILLRDTELTRHYVDGCLWASLGELPDVHTELITWAKALGLRLHGGVSLEDAHKEVALALENRRVLLVIDDIWNVDDAEKLRVAGPNCATLFFTRLPDVAEEIGLPSTTIQLKGLQEIDALNLLQCYAPEVVTNYRKECITLAEYLEGSPLGLNVAGRLLHKESFLGWDIVKFLRELQELASFLEKKVPPDMRDFYNQTTPTVAAVLIRSTQSLSKREMECFAYLGAVSSKPATFDLNFMRFQWSANQEEVKSIVERLAGRGLIEPIGDGHRFQMHALLVELARSFCER